jgi:hypothetical protein
MLHLMNGRVMYATVCTISKIANFVMLVRF